MSNVVIGAEYKVGDELYFSNYVREGKYEKDFRPNTQVTVIAITTDEAGETVYEVETKKGLTGAVYADEVKLKARATDDVIRQTLAKAELLAMPPLDLVDPEEEDKLIQLLTGKNGEPLHLIITNEIQEEFDRLNNDSHEVAQHYLELGNKSYFRLGGPLAKIKLEKEYTKQVDHEGNPYIGNGAFDRYIDEQFPGLSSRVARFYIEIYIAFTNWNMTAEDMGSIGWTTAKEIASISKTEAQARNYVKLASTTKGGWEAVKRDLGISFKAKERITEEVVDLYGGNLKKLTHMNFTVFEDQADQIKTAFDTIYDMYPELDRDKKSHALSVMATEFLNNVREEQGVKMTLDHLIAHGESIYPDKEIFVKDRKTGEVYNPRYGYGKMSLETETTKAGELTQYDELQNTVN